MSRCFECFTAFTLYGHDGKYWDLSALLRERIVIVHEEEEINDGIGGTFVLPKRVIFRHVLGITGSCYSEVMELPGDMEGVEENCLYSYGRSEGNPYRSRREWSRTNHPCFKSSLHTYHTEFSWDYEPAVEDSPSPKGTTNYDAKDDDGLWLLPVAANLRRPLRR